MCVCVCTCMQRVNLATRSTSDLKPIKNNSIIIYAAVNKLCRCEEILALWVILLPVTKFEDLFNYTNEKPPYKYREVFFPFSLSLVHCYCVSCVESNVCEYTIIQYKLHYLFCNFCDKKEKTLN